MHNAEKICVNCNKDFVIEPDDFSFYEKIGVPAPTFCYICRIQRRMFWRNERNFYKRPCDLCKQDFVSTYSLDTPYTVYCTKCFFSDEWDPYMYGIDIDFSKPFFSQWKDLLHKVPLNGMMNDDGIASTNSPYSYDYFFSKNVYLSACGWHSENLYYCFNANYSKEISNSFFAMNSELCNFVSEVEKCFGSVFLFDSENSTQCLYSSDLKNCNNCFLSVGLRNKSYCIKNVQYSKEEYLEKLNAYKLDTILGSKTAFKEMQDFVESFPRRFAKVIQCVNSTGHQIDHAKNLKNSFWTMGPIENSKNIFVTDQGQDSYDANNTGKISLCYEVITTDESANTKFSIFVTKSNYAEYSLYCSASSNIFGCIGLKKGSYSILNKKYSKEEYELLRSKLVAHMMNTKEYGEFFPSAISTYAYNEAQIQEWFPLSQQEIEERSYSFRFIDRNKYKPTKTVKELENEKLLDIADNITSEVIECPVKGLNCMNVYRITERELVIYKKLSCAIPSSCQNCRYGELIQDRPNPLLSSQPCECISSNHEHTGNCQENFETPFNNSQRPLYCENCYQQELY